MTELNVCPYCGARIRCIASVYGDEVIDCEAEKTVVISDVGRRHNPRILSVY